MHRHIELKIDERFNYRLIHQITPRWYFWNHSYSTVGVYHTDCARDEMLTVNEIECNRVNR